MGVQKSKVDDILLFKEKPLLVVLAKEGGELEKNNFNTYFKEAVNNIWKISPSIEFVSPDTYIDLRDNEDRNKKYAYLDFIVMGITGNAPGNSFIVGHTDKRVSPHYTTMYTENNKYTYADLFFYLTILHNDLNDAI
ncbi:hypothetical protein HC176_14575, partial [Tamlana crocina]|nr:hypothetical protein [Tamlana crocina]